MEDYLGALKDLLLHKVSIRLVYIAAAFGSTRFISFVASEEAQTFFNTAGINFQITNPDAFKMWFQLFLLGAGEYIFHVFHKNVILPKVNPQNPSSTQGPPA